MYGSDLSKFKKLLDTSSGKGSVNFKTLAHGSTRDQLHLRDLLEKSVVGLLIEDDGGVELLSNFLLIPLFFLLNVSNVCVIICV